MTHTASPVGYRTYMSAEFITTDPVTGKPIPKILPVDTMVTSILTSFNFRNRGIITGTCRGRPCLEGNFWVTPNLVFEWVYTNPMTGVKRKTRLASNEGKWFFGARERSLVSLRGDGKEVFRAQSSRTVCTAGDGDLETSLVPVGLMLIAENRYNGI